MRPDDLTIDELAWLLNRAGNRRRQLERSYAKLAPKPGQPRAEFFQVRQAKQRALEWARSVEDHLILLVAAADADALNDWQAARLRKIRDEQRVA